MEAVATKDRLGNLVRVGSWVKVLKVPEFLEQAEPETWPDIRSMTGMSLRVYEIDEHQYAWVQGSGRSANHTISLAPDEMELVSMPKRKAMP